MKNRFLNLKSSLATTVLATLIVFYTSTGVLTAESGHTDHSNCSHTVEVVEDHEGHDHSSEEHTEDENHEGHDHSSEKHTEDEDHKGHDHSTEEDEHAGHDHTKNSRPTLLVEMQEFTEVEIKNMQIEVRKLKKETYTKSEEISAEVKLIKQNNQPVYAPWGGKVNSIHTVSGAMAAQDSILLTILRDPIPWVELNLVGGILEPASEQYHELIVSLEVARQQLRNVKGELKSLTKFDTASDEYSLIPQKDLRSLKYEKLILEKTIAGDLNKLKLHGYTKGVNQEIKTPSNDKLWLAALKANGTWTEQSELLFTALPDSIQKSAWAVATVGELTVSSLISADLIHLIRENKTAGKFFLEIGGLIQRGSTVQAISNLLQLNAFNQEVKITAPKNNFGWDVGEVKVRLGQSVEMGEELLSLSDDSQVYLVATPIGEEVSLVVNALQNEFRVAARPLSRGTGPDLNALSIIKLRPREGGGQEALILSYNQSLNLYKNQNHSFRSWALIEGAKYLVQVPIAKLNNVYVLPTKAIIETAGSSFVFVKSSATSFEKREVIVKHKDAQSVVIDLKSNLELGEKVVTTGAFALSLAFLSETPQAVDPHAGHNH